MNPVGLTVIAMMNALVVTSLAWSKKKSCSRSIVLKGDIKMFASKSKIVDLIQGSDEWHIFRKAGIGASDAPVIEGLSPYRTKRELFFEKSGSSIKSEEDPTKEYIFAMGHKVEGLIRKEFQELTHSDIQPVCMVHPKFDYIRASLDGFDPKLGVLEAKLVGQEVLARAREGDLPSHHYSQMQHQFAVSGAEVGQWFGHDGKKSGALVEVRANAEYIKRLLDLEHQFWVDVKSGKAPALSDRDYLELDNDALLISLRDAKELAENAEAQYKAIKDQVVAKYKHPKISGAGLKLFRVTRQGSLNLLSVPEIATAADAAKAKLEAAYIESFRGKGSESWTIRIEGAKK